MLTRSLVLLVCQFRHFRISHFIGILLLSLVTNDSIAKALINVNTFFLKSIKNIFCSYNSNFLFPRPSPTLNPAVQKAKGQLALTRNCPFLLYSQLSVKNDQSHEYKICISGICKTMAFSIWCDGDITGLYRTFHTVVIILALTF